MTDLRPIRDLIDMMNDEYDGAPDSRNRHWGSTIARAERALLVLEENLALDPVGAQSAPHPIPGQHAAGSSALDYTTEHPDGSVTFRVAPTGAAITVDDPGPPARIHDPYGNEMGPAITEDGFPMYSHQGKRADQVEFSGRVVFWCALGLFLLAVALLAVALVAGA